MKKLPKVNVIMATYNGEKFVRTQIDSILAQKDVDVTLNIFDDISSDKTMEILREYEDKYRNVHVYQNEKNKNYTYNFLDALYSFKDCNDFDYYAFADQDDYWLPEKMIVAINKIKEVGKCSLYASNLTIVDKDLQPLNRNMRKDGFKFKKHNEIHGNVVTGCTTVFDGDFKDFVTKHYVKGIQCHDYWLGLLACFGKGCHFILDECAKYILYRQHGHNQVGYKKASTIQRIKILLRGYCVKTMNLRPLITEFREDINEKDVEIIEKFLDYKKCKNKWFLLKNVKTSKPIKFAIMILLNRFKINNKEGK